MSLLNNVDPQEVVPLEVSYSLTVLDENTGDEICTITAPTQEMLVEKFGHIDSEISRYAMELLSLDYEEDLT